MPRPTRSFLALAAAVVVTVPACGGSDDEGLTGDDGSLLAMLGQVPSSGDTREFVVYGNLARLREAAGIDTPTGDSADYVGELTDAVTTGWVVAEPFRNDPRADFRAEVGFDLTDIDVSLQAGLPPDDLAIFTGRIEGEAVDRALTTFEPFADDLDQGERDGVATYRFGEEGELNIDARSPARPLGESLRLGVADGTVLWTQSDSVLDGAIDALRGDGRSLAGLDGFSDVGRALDEAAVHTAVVLGDPALFAGADPAVILGRGASPEQIEAIEEEIEATALAPWRVAALGERLLDDRYEMVIELWHGDEDAARRSAERLELQLREGESFRTAQPWSDICSDPTVQHEGQLVTATCTLDVGGRALSIAQAADSLLVWR